MNLSDNPDNPSRLTKLFWITVAVTPALIALRGVFSSSSIFYVRDLANYFYPNYLWMRQALTAGHLPLWNPDAGAGYANIGDPSFQLFFLPTLFLRFLLPESIGFNFMVAFPFVAAAIGTFLFLKRHVALSSAALGAIIFSVSGPLLSSSNSINPSTTASLLPWLLWATDRLIEKRTIGRFSILSLLFALAFFAGQPDMLAWAALLVILYTGFAIRVQDDNRQTIVGRMLVVIGSGAVGLLLSAIQFLPLLDVMGRSHRGSGTMADGWSIHPVSIIHFFVPTLFSSPLDPTSHLHPWLFQLNHGREPYLISLYLGVTALLLGLFGATAGRPRRWANFWVINFAIFFVLSLGYYTPIYKGLREGLPLLGFFRYPSKLTIFMAFALAVLAASGFEAIAGFRERLEKRRGLWIPMLVAVVLVILSAFSSILVIGFPESAGSLLTKVASSLSLDNSTAAMSDLVYELKQSSPRLAGLALFTAALLWIGVSKRNEAKVARQALFAAIVFDLLMANASLNPTIPVAEISKPQWVAATRSHPQDRVFLDEQSSFSPAPLMPDFTFYVPPDMSLAMADTAYHSIIPYNAIRFGLRDALIVDVTKLRPQEYTQLIKLFRTKDAESRARFLQRTGVRYFLQAVPPACESRVVEPVPTFGNDKFALYEAKEVAPRAAIVGQAEIEPNAGSQFEKLFAADFDPDKSILLYNAPPEPAGIAGQPTAAAADIIEAKPSAVTVKATASEGGGYLLLRDSFDPNWQVEVDGMRAPLLKANGLYRAVRLAPGEHLVRFAYRPRPLYWGAAISGMTAFLLLFLCWRSRRVTQTVAAVEEKAPELLVCEN